ncbi:FAD-dependent oxidoreductase [Ureibacillus aquaedulcis]|uniref:FAD-dependent oxidoreductase n=1 Tax=Ureibacillus aquaedulcis TaxID=3058421 RepID=A0ABT8GKP3_9BACL|nr:FAD-dependent oxidoreductase [Ureibacillus sp. BA0131]MDN4491982.1 FAD-dependent oxidoreductase [Ureibacillus sp. BA0131]
MEWDAEVDVIVVGAGGGGAITALTVAQEGLDVALFEKTDFLLGNTAASAGMIPACGTRFQKDLQIADSIDIMTNDILKKNHFESNAKQVQALASISGPLVEWMNDDLKIEMSVVTEFKYPGHSSFRMHAPPSRSGLELMKKLKKRILEHENIYLLLNSTFNELITDGEKVLGIKVKTPDGEQCIKGRAVVIATNGFGGNKEMVNQYIPEIADALYFGYEANEGEGIQAGIKIGAMTSSLTAYQGHAAVNEQTGLLVTWGTIMMGGFYINLQGQRFANEAQGYSEFAKEVLKQEGQKGYIVYDQNIHNKLLSIEDYKQINEMEAYKKANTIKELAQLIQVNPNTLSNTMDTYLNQTEGVADIFGRNSFGEKLRAPYYAIKVSPALFHTQGGLSINTNAQVINTEGEEIPNLYAVGGSAVGVSGNHAYGYMSGNGLLAALGFGRIAGLNIISNLVANKEEVIND